MTSLIGRELRGTTCVLTFDRPQALNALTEDMEAELHEALDVAEGDDAVRAIVLTGAGRAFCTGYEMGPRPPASSTTELLRRRWDTYIRGPRKLMHVMELGKPVIAAVNGWALGGGFWYALCADVTIAGQSATFGQPEVRQNANSSVLFAALAGWKNAHRYALTGDHFDAAEALRIGVVNQVVPDEEVLTTAVALADRMGLLPPDALRINKAVTTQGMYAMGLANALSANAMLSVLVTAAKDAPEMAELTRLLAEGDMRAFLTARDGPFLPEPGGPRSRPRPQPAEPRG
ncbi:hypothetical protein PSU4_55010 [Pseudonocardia sulfidoxydans NBRC 16205]|uniref:Enoyl-CoA hydratase n=1 Tax=Pseudonocardia sulfidoxydans NBRC 16205 TaxID=1223511 RepID=A0A511DQB6_9PSEU|nr:enoyl-CoA hydratase/isomerase family protein [Pseudonocardia sulfidoxydans]GEL26547.1 hypothetical protein PSU4_55010 [Pseudonocardia sulfidoxydans NBRC 16205]